MAGAFSVLLVFNKNQLSQPSGKRKGKQIEFTWPLPNTLCCIMAEHEAETNSKTKNQALGKQVRCTAHVHHCLGVTGWLLHTLPVLPWPPSSPVLYFYMSPTPGLRLTGCIRDRNVAVGPFLLKAGLPEGLLLESSVPAPTPAQRFYQRRDLEGHPAPTCSQAPLDKCSHKYLFFKEKKKIFTHILFNIKHWWVVPPPTISRFTH